MELIKPVKPYLEKHYVVAADRTDLYAYFFERGVGVLKDGGRLGYISSSTFFRTGSGENLRTFLGDDVAVEAVVDFGDLQIFEGVTTYPAIVTLRKGDGGGRRRAGVPQDRRAAEGPGGGVRRQGAGHAARAARRGLVAVRGRAAGEAARQDRQGQEDAGRGLRRAAVRHQDRPQRGLHHRHGDARPAGRADPKSAELLKPFLRGENIKRWRVEPEGLFLINTPKGKVDIDDYPAIRDWLLPFKPELEKRATKQEWFELQQAQLAYQPRLAAPKIVYGHFAHDRIICVRAPKGSSSNNKCLLYSSMTRPCSRCHLLKAHGFVFPFSRADLKRVVSSIA